MPNNQISRHNEYILNVIKMKKDRKLLNKHGIYLFK